MNNRICNWCKGEIKEGTRSHAKFCCRTCATRSHAKKSYDLHKNEVKYKLRSKKRYTMWRKKNRLHFNDLVREANRVQSQKYRELRLSKGLCIHCGKVPSIPEHQACEACIVKRKYYQKTYLDKKNMEVTTAR